MSKPTVTYTAVVERGVSLAKETGIREILGASVAGILKLFINDIVWLIIIACIIAFPIAYFVMQVWLNNYAYKIQMNAFPFMIAFAIFSCITILLICIHSMQSEITNPIKTLRSE